MNTKQILLYVAGGLCFLGAADAWLDVGAAQWLVNLCLSDPDATMPDMPAVLTDEHHSGHVFLWMTVGGAFMLAATSFEYIEDIFSKRSKPIDHRRRMVAALLHVAHAGGPVRQSVVDDAFHTATGDRLGPKEAYSAYRSCFRDGAPTLARILSGVTHAEERRQLVVGVAQVWFATGMDSVEGTQKLDDVIELLGLGPDQVAAYLDPQEPRLSRGITSVIGRISTAGLMFRGEVT